MAGAKSIRSGGESARALGIWTVGLVVALLAVACGRREESAVSTVPPVPTTSATSVAPPSTADPAEVPPSTTTERPGSDGLPAFFRYDASGAYLVTGVTERQITADAVQSATHDAMGGVVFAILDATWAPGLRWWKSGTTGLETLPFDSGWIAPLGGGPVLVTPAGDCPTEDARTLVELVDLRTGERRPLGCFGGEDGGTTITSGGGELLVGVTWIGPGATGSDRTLDFYDAMGTEVEHPYNPVAESCEPCELDARLSPDGSLLAYRVRPDAKWSTDLDELQRLDAMSWDDWWETSRHIGARLTVLDLTSGDERFEVMVPAGERLVDFDGRFLVLESTTMKGGEEHEQEPVYSSRVVDTTRSVPELTVGGRVRLASYVIGDPPTADIFPPYLRVWSPEDGAVVNERTIRFEGIADLAADLVAAGRYPVEIQPHGAWSIVLALEPGRNEATFTATDAAGNEAVRRVAVTYVVGGVLRPDGIGPVDFGTRAEDAMEALVGLFDPPTQYVESGEHECSAFETRLDHATWEELGLRVVFTDWEGPLHLASWHVIGPGIATAGGIGWGSVVDEVRAAYPAATFGINEWAPEFAADGMRGGFNWPGFVADLQVALNERGAGLDVTGEWDGPTTAALLHLIEDQGLHGSEAVLGVLGLPPGDVSVSWMVAGQESSCA